MKTLNYVLALISGMVLLGACSKDSTEADNNNNIGATVQEYPAVGSTIATLSTNLSEPVSYSITSESVNRAFGINSVTGELVVGNPLAFDYEISPTLNAVVTASNGNDTEDVTVEVTVEDIDDIEFVLSESKETYQNAVTGEWLEISQQEYDSLSVIINSISFVASTESYFANAANGVSSFTYQSNSTVANEGSPLPKGEYLFAFKYVSGATIVNNAKVKLSELRVSSGYEDFGSPLPPHGDGVVCFVLKGNNSIYSQEAYLAMYSENSIAFNLDFPSTDQHYFRSGDTNTIADSNSASVGLTICLYQGLSTPIKQWN